MTSDQSPLQLHQLLKDINRQGSSRYTAIFAYEDQNLHNALIYDREQPELTRLEEPMAVDTSYCVFVRQTRNTFIVVDSLDDPRVQGHAKQFVFRSYLGVPIYNDDGSLWGTICFFDTEASNFTPEQILQLEQTASRLKNGFPYVS